MQKIIDFIRGIVVSYVVHQIVLYVCNQREESHKTCWLIAWSGPHEEQITMYVGTMEIGSDTSLALTFLLIKTEGKAN